MNQFTEKVLCIDMRRVCPVCLILSVNELTVSTVNLTHVAAKIDKDKNDFISLILVASILSKSITLNRLMIHYLKKKLLKINCHLELRLLVRRCDLFDVLNDKLLSTNGTPKILFICYQLPLKLIGKDFSRTAITFRSFWTR